MLYILIISLLSLLVSRLVLTPSNTKVGIFFSKYPKKLVKFNIFNIRKLEFDATDIDISPIRQIDISLNIITDIEINHIEIRSKDLDDYRYEIVSNRRDIDIYKDGVVNIDFNINFNSREININSNCEIEIDNISINKSIR